MNDFAFSGALERALTEEFPSFSGGIVLERCPDGMNGDYSINCFKFARGCGAAPDKVADFVVKVLSADPGIEAVERIKGFVNLTVKAELLHRTIARDVDGLLAAAALPEAERSTILIEYSAPNTNKPQHLGHVRNNTLGMAVASLLKRAGHTVHQINLVNDRGIHICKSMLAYQRFGHGETPESSGVKGDHLVGNYYVRFNAELTGELAALRQARPELADKDDEALFGETELGAAARRMLIDWEAGDPAVRELWRKMNSWVFAGFDQTYKRMGIHFDRTYLESDTYLLGKDIISGGLAQGVFTKRADGAVVVDLGKLGTKVVLRSDGTSVYMTQDMGTTVLKHRDFKPDEMIWVVGDEQNLHFQMLFEILRMLKFEWAQRLIHLSYGMVNLPSGKMKSREGTVVDADDLFEEMVNLAESACRERASEGDSAETIRRRAEIIGMGALKFMLLKFNAKTTILFDPAASIRFEGDTGPYVQYACARIQSILRKAAERGIDFAVDCVDWGKLVNPAEKALSVRLGGYPAAIQTAATRRDASNLVEYLLDLARDFNRFYRECPVLAAESPELAAARLALASAVHRVLADGLNTLTIEVPEAM